MIQTTYDGLCNVFCDNNAVFNNSCSPESMLKKKHAAINYHRTRDAVAAGVIRIAKENTAKNLADILTNVYLDLRCENSSVAFCGKWSSPYFKRTVDLPKWKVHASVGG